MTRSYRGVLLIITAAYSLDRAVLCSVREEGTRLVFEFVPPHTPGIFKEPPAGFRLIAPDLRGHGASTNPSGEFSFRQAADDVAGLLRHLGLDTVKAIGLSGGGIVLLHLATALPTRIESMVIVSAPPYFPAQARALQRQTSDSMFGEGEMDLMRKRHRLRDQW